MKSIKDAQTKMHVLASQFFRFALSSEEGQGISEYLIILAVVVIAAIALATTFSDQLTALWGSITSQLSAIS